MRTDKYENFKRNENSYVRREVRRLAKRYGYTIAKLKAAKEREELERQSH